jgi:uncharacterized repeat protein (TIGR01451 family)
MGTLAGQVTQAHTGLPLEATISAASAYTTFETISDPATGLYNVTVFSDTYAVTGQAVGYIPATFNDVTVTQGQTTTRDFVLPLQLQLDKTVTPDQVFPGDPLTYTLTFTNNGAVSVTHVVVTDALPAHTAFAWASDGGAIADSVVSWDLPVVSPYETLSLTLVVTVTGVPPGSAMFPLVNAVYGARSDQTPSPAWGQPVTVIVHSPFSNFYLPVILRKTGHLSKKQLGVFTGIPCLISASKREVIDGQVQGNDHTALET